MKVRTKFTLWISLAALSTATVFSLFVYLELVAEPIKLIDRELAEVAGTVFSSIDFSQAGLVTRTLIHDDQHLERYWLKILDSKGQIIFASPLSQKFEIPLPHNREAFFLKKILPPSSLWIDPQDVGEMKDITDDTVRFRVKVLTRKHAEDSYTVLIAKPLLFLDLELHELLTRLITGIFATIILIFLMGYFLAGKILQPLTTINQKVKDIRENSLNQRISLGSGRDELYILGHSLNTMFDRLRHSFSRQKEFIGNAAHELKSPLTILMLGHEEMLADRLAAPIRSELEKQLNTMRRLSKLVRNLLDISRLEQEETCAREPVRLDVLIHQVLEEYREILQAQNITVETEIEECPLLGDPEKILRLIINLLDNAIKYNKADSGNIRITVRKNNEKTLLAIANTGPEISAADLPRLFDQFFRVEKSRSQAFGGSGLGLTIVHRIIELHDGTVEVQSRNGWTTFTINLP